MRGDGTSLDASPRLRYAQCWEDADVLLGALDIQPGHVCLSIASAGDNTLAMLSRGPERVIAVDLSLAQLACLELRVAGYRELSHREVLELVGSLPSRRRDGLYRRCRGALSADARRFWDQRPADILRGIGHAGRFEQYFALFRSCIVPLIHPWSTVEDLLESRPRDRREAFYRQRWDTWRWRLAFRIFFSELVMAGLGCDSSTFRYVRGSVAGRILERTRHALTALDPARNPYLQWILTGHHVTSLPYARRPENFDAIRAHLGRLEWRWCAVEDFLEAFDPGAIDRYNLSDIFEYVSEEHYHDLLARAVRAGRSGGRLAYWNMLVERRRPVQLADRLRPLTELAGRFHQEDKAFFYNAFVVEEII